jgi:hypothetical protein
VDFDQALVLRPLHNGMGKGADQQLGQAGKNVDAHFLSRLLMAFRR